MFKVIDLFKVFSVFNEFNKKELNLFYSQSKLNYFYHTIHIQFIFLKLSSHLEKKNN